MNGWPVNLAVLCRLSFEPVLKIQENTKIVGAALLGANVFQIFSWDRYLEHVEEKSSTGPQFLFTSSREPVGIVTDYIVNWPDICMSYPNMKKKRNWYKGHAQISWSEITQWQENGRRGGNC